MEEIFEGIPEKCQKKLMKESWQEILAEIFQEIPGKILEIVLVESHEKFLELTWENQGKNLKRNSLRSSERNY